MPRPYNANTESNGRRKVFAIKRFKAIVKPESMKRFRCGKYTGT